MRFFAFLFISALFSSAPAFATAPSCRTLLQYPQISVLQKGTQQVVTDLSLSEGAPNPYESLKVISGRTLEGNALAAADNASIRFWMNADKYRPVVSDRISNTRDPRFESKEEVYGCGTCKVMLPLHLRSLVLPMLERAGRITREEQLALDPFAAITGGKFVLVYVRGELVGAVKALSGERYEVTDRGFLEYDLDMDHAPVRTPTFLALRNVVNSKGEVALAMGGVYYVTKEFLASFYFPAINAQGPYLAKTVVEPGQHVERTGPVRRFLNDFQVGVAHVDRLEVSPESFLFNDVGMDAPANRQLLDSLFPVTGGVTKPERLQSRWSQVLDTLDAIRGDLEVRGKSDPQLRGLREEIRGGFPRPSISVQSNYYF